MARLVFADWLDENGEHEEADRQRKWPAAKAWLVRLCRGHNPPSEDDDDDENPYVISYKKLIALGREAIEHAQGAKGNQRVIGFSCESDMSIAMPSEPIPENSGRTGPS